MGHKIECLEQRNLLKECFSCHHFLSRMFGVCDSVEKDFKTCMDHEIKLKQEINKEKGRERVKRWQENNKELGIRN